MNMKKRILLNISILCCALLLPVAAAAQVGVVRERQVRNLLTRIETRTDALSREVNSWVSRTPYVTTNREERITDLITDFEGATDAMRQNFTSNRNIGGDLNEALNRATFINRFMSRNRVTPRAQSQWMAIRGDLDTLARYYTVAWDWNRTPGRNVGRNRFDDRLTGTYRLNRTLSDNINAVLDKWDNVYNTAQRDRMRRNLERRLTSPEMIAIEKNGRTVTMASSLLPQVSFEVDGIARPETTNRGRTITTTATASRDAIQINTVGDRSNDFYLTISPLRNDQLRITRRLHLENRNETVSVTSVYDKINETAQWSVVNTGDRWRPGRNGSVQDFYIPDGTRLTAVLNNPLTTDATQVGDRFTMRVTSPARYRDAMIEGHVSRIDDSGRLSGRANVLLDFDSIRLTNGQVYQFAGTVNSVRAPNGDDVSVTNEGTIRDSNQTTRTVTRAGIGAALGALIGAIAGGGEGAAVGAAVGAGAGAGSVLIQGRDDIDLGQGTEFSITASAPSNVGLFR